MSSPASDPSALLPPPPCRTARRAEQPQLRYWEGAPVPESATGPPSASICRRRGRPRRRTATSEAGVRLQSGTSPPSPRGVAGLVDCVAVDTLLHGLCEL